MKIEQRLIGEIHPYEKNAKVHSEKQVRQVADSIENFGFNQPIVVDKNDVIIVGHGRFAAAELLGLEKVPVLKVNISEEAAKAYRLADNKLNESPWDLDLVIPELKDLSPEMLELTGFDKDLLLDQVHNHSEVKGQKCLRCEEIRQAIDGHFRRSGHKPIEVEEILNENE